MAKLSGFDVEIKKKKYFSENSQKVPIFGTLYLCTAFMINRKNMLDTRVVDNLMESIFCTKYFFRKCTVSEL